MFASCVEREPRALAPSSRICLEHRAARAHERVLGDHEERVDRDQHGREDDSQSVHAATSTRAVLRPAPREAPEIRRLVGPVRAELLRGSSSSSFILCRHAKGSKAPRRKREESFARWTSGRGALNRQHGPTGSSMLPASAKSAAVSPPLGVRRERQADLVPAVHEDVWVVVGVLGASAQPASRARSRRRSRRARSRARWRSPSRCHSEPC